MIAPILFFLMLLLPFIYAPFLMDIGGGPDSTSTIMGAVVLRALLFLPLGFAVVNLIGSIIDHVREFRSK